MLRNHRHPWRHLRPHCVLPTGHPGPHTPRAWLPLWVLLTLFAAPAMAGAAPAPDRAGSPQTTPARVQPAPGNATGRSQQPGAPASAGEPAKGEEPGRATGEEGPAAPIPSPGAGLRRVEIGLQMPAISTQNYRAIPGQDYVLGPYDQLSISLTGLKPEEWEVAVSPQGTVSLPLVGAVRCSGLTVGALHRTLAEKLRRYYRDFSLSISVKEVRGIQVTVAGQVMAPGSYNLAGLTPVWQAIQAAGGITPAGSVRSVRIRSTAGKERVVDLYPFLFRAAGDGNVALETGDTVIVPVAECVVGLAGEVRRPGLYEFRPGETLLQLLELAGGATAEAALEKAYIERVGPDRTRRVVRVDLSQGGRSASPELQDGDVVVIPALGVYMGQVRIEGEVRIPGTYERKQNMRLRDLLHLAGNCKATAALSRTYVERYQGNEKPCYVWVDAGKALAGDEAANIPLEEGDVVHVPAIPQVGGSVEVRGEVRQPGIHPWGQGMTVRDLIGVAGGLTPLAAPGQAYIERFDAPGGQKRLLWIDAARALAGSGADNIPLCDADVLVIPQKRTYLGTVGVTGELRGVLEPEEAGGPAEPGAKGAQAGQRDERRAWQFELAEGMRVSDLVKLAGGPRATADLERARLIRIGANGMKEAVRVNLRRVLAGVGSADDLALRDGDVLEVPSIAMLQQVVRVSGELVGTGVFQSVVDSSGSLVVKRLGNYELKEGDTVRDLVASLGGCTVNANLRAARIERRRADGTVERIPVDLHRLLIEKDETANAALRNGDEFIVPAIADMVYVVGGVNRPGAYDYREGNNRVIDMLNRAGGVAPRGKRSTAYLIRNEEGGRQKPLRVDLDAILKRGRLDRDPGVRPGDVLFVPEKLVTYQEVMQVLTTVPLLRYYFE